METISLELAVEVARGVIYVCSLVGYLLCHSRSSGRSGAGGARVGVSHRECVDPRKMQSPLSQSLQSWNTKSNGVWMTKKSAK